MAVDDPFLVSATPFAYTLAPRKTALVVIDEDATASYVPAYKEATLAMVAAQGAIVGWHAPSSALLAALRADRTRSARDPIDNAAPLRVERPA